MQSQLPAPGTLVWIRQTRWRIERARREQGVIRLEVSGRPGPKTFLAPFDRPRVAEARGRPTRIRSQAVVARLAGLIAGAASCRTLVCARSADIDLHAYQLEPALAMQARARRVLIADAVGLGKTIQAGLVIAEVRARQPAASVLVIVPSFLRRQWSDELRTHFRLDTQDADAAGLEGSMQVGFRGAAPWDIPGVWVGSMDFLKQPHVLASAAQHVWDLVVIDEAHAVCGCSERRVAADALARRSRRVLLLSATPHNGDDTRFERLLGLGALSHEDELVVFRRTHATLGMERRRRVHWHAVGLTREETRLLDALVAFERTALRKAGLARRPAALLLLSVFRKRALSTTAALVLSLDRRLTCLERPRGAPNADAETWQQPSLGFDAEADDWNDDERNVIGIDIGVRLDLERSWLRRLRELARAASRDESKVRHVLTLARRTQEPLVIFTEFRDSVTCLLPRLQRVRSVAVLHGGLAPAEQRAQLEEFLSGRATALVATDVASQGLESAVSMPLGVEPRGAVESRPSRAARRSRRSDRAATARPRRPARRGP